MPLNRKKATALALLTLTTILITSGAVLANPPAEPQRNVVAAPAAKPAAIKPAASAVTSYDPAIWAFEAPALGLASPTDSGATLLKTKRISTSYSPWGSTSMQTLDCVPTDASWAYSAVPNRTETSWAYPQGFYADPGKLTRSAGSESAAIRITMIRPATPKVSVDIRDFACGYQLTGQVYPAGADAKTITATVGQSTNGTAIARGSLDGTISLENIGGASLAPLSVTAGFWALTADGRQIPVRLSVQFVS